MEIKADMMETTIQYHIKGAEAYWCSLQVVQGDHECAKHFLRERYMCFSDDIYLREWRLINDSGTIMFMLEHDEDMMAHKLKHAGDYDGKY